MTIAHTPGPWHVGPDSNGRIIYDDTGWAIADAKLFHGNRKSGEDVHNARLIAAAPELLEAAIAACAYDDAIRSCANDPGLMSSFCTAKGDNLDTLYERWQTLSRAAIAKVIGSAS